MQAEARHRPVQQEWNWRRVEHGLAIKPAAGVTDTSVDTRDLGPPRVDTSSAEMAIFAGVSSPSLSR